MPTFHKAVIIGVGLIGGSLGRAIRSRGLADRVVGVVRSDASARRTSACDVVDLVTQDLKASVQEADLIVSCTPVAAIVDSICRAAANCPAEALLTDAGSTKASVVALIEERLAERSPSPYFIGGHPLAGDHRTGPESARDDLFVGKRVVLTPTEKTPPDAVGKATDFWASLGASVVQMTPDAHDATLAHASHLPHLVASVLAATTPEEALALTATGWRDTTRVAAGSASLWRDIVMTNRPALLAAIDDFENIFARLRKAIADGDSRMIERLLEEGRQRRDALGS